MQESIVMDERNRKLQSINFEKCICSSINDSYEHGWIVIKLVIIFDIYSLLAITTYFRNE